jgi:N-acetylglutamate synthase-like GNAT family acetyltransferase
VSGERPQVTGLPLSPWEREGLIAALAGAGLPTADVQAPGPLFWRFENDEGPLGFGGLEIHDDQALLRSVVTLPPLRRRGFGRAIVETLETEARVRDCNAVWLLAKETGFFARLGYRQCAREEMPKALRETALFTRLCPASTIAMTKRLD